MEFLNNIFKRKSKVATAKHRNPDNLRRKRNEPPAPPVAEVKFFSDLKDATDKGSGFNYGETCDTGSDNR